MRIYAISTSLLYATYACLLLLFPGEIGIAVADPQLFGAEQSVFWGGAFLFVALVMLLFFFVGEKVAYLAFSCAIGLSAAYLIITLAVFLRTGNEPVRIAMWAWVAIQHAQAFYYYLKDQRLRTVRKDFSERIETVRSTLDMKE